MISVQLDLCGEVCPAPLLKAQEAFRQVGPDAKLVVETDFARAVRNISHWCGREGLYCQIDDLRHGTWRITIQRAPFVG